MRFGDAFEHVRDDILPRLSGLGLESTQVSEETRALAAVGPHGFVLRDELEQFFAGDAVGLGRPIAPAIGRLDNRAIFLTGQLRFLFCGDFHVVEKLEKEDPSEERKAVEVAIEALVLPHDLAGGLNEGAKALRRGPGGAAFFRWGFSSQRFSWALEIPIRRRKEVPVVLRRQLGAVPHRRNGQLFQRHCPSWKWAELSVNREW